MLLNVYTTISVKKKKTLVSEVKNDVEIKFLLNLMFVPLKMINKKGKIN